MKKRSKLRWFFSILGLLAICVLIWFLGPLITVAGQELLASEFVRLGIIAFTIIVWLVTLLVGALRGSRASDQLAEGMVQSEAPKDTGPSVGRARGAEEVAALRQRFDEAMTVLKKARGAGAGNLYELPWYIIIGPPGSGKTTALVNSGLDFPLAERFGKASIRGVGGTRNCDWWFSNDAVLLDTAGRFVTQDSDKAADAAAWEGFLRLLKRHRRRRPINGVLIAVSASDLMLQSEREREAHVRAIKGRIQELYTFFGIRFPVYVMLTKCDLIAGFMEFFDDLGREERAQVWGTTFQLDGTNPVAELSAEYDALLGRLNDRLIWRMENERDPQRRALIYGFPQQMASLKDVLVSFLGDVFSASRFDEQPILRGVYFSSGTQEGTPIDRIVGSVARSFGIDVQSVSGLGGQGRSYFLTDLLKRVVFAEAEIVGTNRRLEKQRSWLQRIAYALAFVAVLGAVLAWSASYIRNLEYVARMQAKVDAYNELAKQPVDPKAGFDGPLPALDALRETTEVYDEYDQDVPWYMQLGMYQGRKLGGAAREAYLREMRRGFLPLITDRLAQRVVSSDDPDFKYTALKAYVMLGQQEHLDPELVTLWMTLEWQAAYPDDVKKQDRLNAHLTVLLEGGFEPVALDMALLESARRQLTQVPLYELAYGRLKRDAVALQKNPFRISDAVGNAGARVFDRKSGRPLEEPVPELFTYRGYYEVYQTESRLLVAKLRDERWVLGLEDDAFGARELEQLDQRLGELYADDYVRRWQQLLSDLRIRPFNSVEDGITTLEILSGRRSPLRGLLEAVQRNTALSVLPGGVAQVAEKAGALGAARDRLSRLLGSTEQADKPRSPAQIVDEEFADLNAVVKPEEGDPPLDSLIALLARVYGYLDGVSAGQADEAGAAVLRRLRNEAVAQPEPLKSWLRGLVDATDTITGRKREADELQAKSEQRDAILKAMNDAWSADVLPMCRKGMEGRYPVFRESAQEMTLRDFGILFGDGGLLDRFFGEHLKPFVDTSRTPWRWREAEGVSLGLSNKILLHFDLAEQVRSTFFRDGGTKPAVSFQLRPSYLDDGATQFHLDLEGQKFVYRHGPSRAQKAQWPNPDGNTQVLMFFEDGNGKRSTVKKDGAWGWFRLLDEARVERLSAERIMVTFSAGQLEARYEIIASSVINPFMLEGLPRFRCPEKF